MALNRKDALLTEPPWWLLLRIGLPLAVGMSSHVMFNLVDLLLVGRLGEGAAAAAHVATIFNFLLMIVGNGISVATISILSRRIGAGEMERARRLSSRSQVMMLWLGTVVGVLGAAIAVPCVALTGVEGEVRSQGVHFLVVLNLGAVTMFMLMQTTSSMRALGDVWMPLVLLLGANVLNLLLDIVLLFGWEDLGIPAFGAPGAAYATVIARGLASAFGLWWLARKDNPLRFTWMPWRDRHGEWLTLLVMAVPQIVQVMVRALTVIALTRVARDLAGPEAVPALSVTSRLDTMVLFAAVGFASAATTVTGRNVGARLVRRARVTAVTGGAMALIMGGIMVLFFARFAGDLIGLFVVDAGPRVLEIGESYLMVAALGHPFGAFCVAVAGGLNGAGRMVPPMVLDLVGYVGVILPALVLTAVLRPAAGLVAIWWVFAAGNALLGLVYLVYALRAGWPHRRP